MRQTDVKVLWGRAAARCAMPDCRVKLTQQREHATDAYPLGEQAHIVGDRPTAARGDSPLTDAERDGYPNRILLCPTHHVTIDKDPEAWPIERLHIVKTEHELWVERKLADEASLHDQADDLIYAHLVDSAVELCHLDVWSGWVSRALDPVLRMPASVVDDVGDFHVLVKTADWPSRHLDLECALHRLADTLSQAVHAFVPNAELAENDVYRLVQPTAADKAQDPEWHERYRSWMQSYEASLVEATKATNWLREIWRREFNPLFFAVEGHFYLELWPDEESDDFTTHAFRYSDEEKAELLARQSRV